MNARISEEQINELRQSVDIVEVISDYVQLKKQGRNHFGLCPFHGENTPSFSVSAEKQIFHCFGCGAGGNVFTFLMDIDGLTFHEAALKVAAKGDFPLEAANITGRSHERQLPPEQQQMIEAHELLAKFFHHLLLNTDEGSHALEYLLNRGFTHESISKFQIGYSLPEWNFSVKFLENRGYSLELIEKAGLIGKRENDHTYFDRFRNRIMFPLQDAKGKVIAFSARTLGEEQPKYLNSPETILFNKSTLLYNYYQARSHIRKQGSVVLFEGFADVISADAAGVHNGVAVMGTSLTAKHTQTLRRLTDSVTLCFDSDMAGMEAAYRAGEMLDEHGLSVTVALMPSTMDPDDYIRENGPEKFRSDVIGNGLTWMAYKLHYHRQGKNLQNEGEKLRYIEEVMKEISKLGNPVERDLYTRQIAEEFNLSLEALIQQQRQLDQTQGRKQRSTTNSKQSTQASVQPAKGLLPAHMAAERHLIARMLKDEELAYRVMDMLGDTTFHYDEHQAIVTYLFGYYEDGNPPNPSAFLHFLPDKKLRAIVTEIEMLSIDTEYDEKELRDYVSHVLKYPKMLMIKEKQAEQKAAERNNDVVKAMEIAKEIIELKRSL